MQMRCWELTCCWLHWKSFLCISPKKTLAREYAYIPSVSIHALAGHKPRTFNLQHYNCKQCWPLWVKYSIHSFIHSFCKKQLTERNCTIKLENWLKYYNIIGERWSKRVVSSSRIYTDVTRADADADVIRTSAERKITVTWRDAVAIQRTCWHDVSRTSCRRIILWRDDTSLRWLDRKH